MKQYEKSCGNDINFNTENHLKVIRDLIIRHTLAYNTLQRVFGLQQHARRLQAPLHACFDLRSQMMACCSVDEQDA